MFEAVYMAATGIANQQKRLDTIADNIANANTLAFKGSRLDFKDALYTAGMSPGPAYTAGGNLQKGHGVMVSAITRNFDHGILQQTENMLDLAIEGDGFFQLDDGNNNLLYTKAGNFYTSPDDRGLTVVNAQGFALQSVDGEAVIIPQGTTEIEVSPEGIMSFSGGEEELGSIQLGVYNFANNRGLSGVGESNYIQTAASGEVRPAEDVNVRQFALESSNVDMSVEMTRLLRTQRAFSLASRALKTADEMEGIANNIRR